MNTQNNAQGNNQFPHPNPNVENQNYYRDQLPPTQGVPQMPGNIQQPRVEQAPQGFILDAATRHIISTVHPELVSAFVNIAIKKFALEGDFQEFFVQDQYRDETAVQREEQQAAASPAPAANASLNFGGGW